MNKTTQIIVRGTVLASLFMLMMASVMAQNFTAVPASSALTWTGYAEVGEYSQTGKLEVKSGAMVLKNDSIQSLEVIVDMKSLHHEDKDLKKHLKDEDFFDVKKHPTATLKFRSQEGTTYLFDLSIRGVTQPITIPVKLEKTGNGMRAKGTIMFDRTKFEIKYNSSTYFQDAGSYAIKNDVQLVYDITFEQRID